MNEVPLSILIALGICVILVIALYILVIKLFIESLQEIKMKYLVRFYDDRGNLVGMTRVTFDSFKEMNNWAEKERIKYGYKYYVAELID